MSAHQKYHGLALKKKTEQLEQHMVSIFSMVYSEQHGFS
jgi:hypothetical protein